MWRPEHGQAGSATGIWCASGADRGVDAGGDGVAEVGRTDVGGCAGVDSGGLFLHIIY